MGVPQMPQANITASPRHQVDPRAQGSGRRRDPSIVVLGGGVIGTIAKLVFPDAVVLEAAKGPPSQSSFSIGTKYLWEDIPVLDTFKVKVITTIDSQKANEALARDYKRKIGKESDIYKDDWKKQFQYAQHGYSFHRLPDLPKQWGHKVDEVNWHERHVWCKRQLRPYAPAAFKYDVLINTLPLPIVVKCLHEGPTLPVEFNEAFPHKPVWVLQETWPYPITRSPHIHVNYITVPEEINPFYRQTIVGNTAQFETLRQLDEGDYEPSAVKHQIHKLPFGKLWESDFSNALVQDLEEKSIYCVGRFGAWNPEELTHQSYQKLLEIKGAIGYGS